MQRRSKLTWIGGAYFFDDHNEGDVEITVYPAIQIRPFAKIGTDARALFGQATYSVSTRVSVTGGVRYTDEQKDLDSTGGVYRLGTDILLNPATFYDYVESATFHAWTPKLAMQVQASPNTFGYVSATRGFKSGGFNPAARKPELAAFEPEFAWSYEAGLKRSMAGGRVRANTAVFHSDYRDLQVQSFLEPGVPDISNAGSATINGVEVEVDADAGHGVQLAGHVVVARRDLRLLPRASAGRRDARRGRQSAQQRPRMVRQRLGRLRVRSRAAREDPPAWRCVVAEPGVFHAVQRRHRDTGRICSRAPASRLRAAKSRDGSWPSTCATSATRSTSPARPTSRSQPSRLVQASHASGARSSHCGAERAESA